MNNNSTIQLAPVPSLSPHLHKPEMSPLTAILSLLVLIAIPGFIYAFFFAITCPRIPVLRRLVRRSGGSDDIESRKASGRSLELVSGVKYAKETNGEEYGSECPVCLSAFVDGDYVRQLNYCKHCFHVACIDKWLYSHSNCPVCRASVMRSSVVIPKRPSLERVREDDLRQGLPDAASLV
ncbi:hypothetical protein M9H77_03555 [Catharanthus roseus]|uniref:Uncharacterized protein n=1 Tax=Catharanthus roseus TaxID=4058 RepID=A0ACC0CBK0_CATRO|nr:hypothetical protein M9H77_03555 [Catharanthus roseus]